VSVTKKGLSSCTLHVSDAREPFWLVLGESRNDGWHARIGSTDLGPPQLVDGYANGWLVTPASTTLTVHLEWTPQRLVWIGLAISAAAVVVCSIIVVRGRRAPAMVTAGPVLDVRSAPGPAPWRVIAVATVLVAAASFVVSGAVIAAVAAAVAVVGLRTRRIRRLGGAIAAATPLLVGLYTAARQFHSDYPPGIEWPAAMTGAHAVSLAALVVFAVDAVVRWLRHRHGQSRHQLATTGRPSS
jgi:arabinofuranan 3-O-arabinosyltransferase